MAKARAREDGKFWSDKLMDLANLSSVVLIFEQLVVKEIRWDSLGIGIGFYVIIALIVKRLRR